MATQTESERPTGTWFHLGLGVDFLRTLVEDGIAKPEMFRRDDGKEATRISILAWLDGLRQDGVETIAQDCDNRDAKGRCRGHPK